MEDLRSRAERLLFSSHVVDRKTGAADLARHLRGTRDAKALRMLLAVAGNGVEHPLVRGEAHRAIALIAADPGPTDRRRAEVATAERALPPGNVAARVRQLQEELFQSGGKEAAATQATLLQAASQARGLLFSEPEPEGRAGGAARLGELLRGTRDATALRTLLTVLANTAESEVVRDAAYKAVLDILADPFAAEVERASGDKAGSAGRVGEETGWDLVRRLQEEMYSGQVNYGQAEWLLTYGNVVDKLLERVPELKEVLGPPDPDLPHFVFDRLFDLVLDAARVTSSASEPPSEPSAEPPAEPSAEPPAVPPAAQPAAQPQAQAEDLLKRALDFIEEAVVSHDAHVVNVIAVSFMERLSLTGPRLDLGTPKPHRELVASRLGPASAKLLREVGTWWERFDVWTRSR